MKSRYGLAALDLKDARDQMIAASGGGPGDVADFIAFAIFAEAIEFATLSALPATALFEFDLAAANQIEGVLFGFIEIWKHGYRLLRVRHGPAFRDAQSTLITDIDSA